MKKLINHVIVSLKKFYDSFKKNLSVVLNKQIRPMLIQKKEQLENNHKRRMDKKAEIVGFRVREEFNKIRINMDTINKDIKNNCILISSPSLSDGKTTICVNMAQYMAKFGKRTIIVDCNMRAPKIKKIFKIDLEIPGLGDIMINDSKTDECILTTDIENLYIITAGCKLDDPVGMLASDKMDNLIKSLMKKFDFVLLDTPSILLVPDTIALAKHVLNIYLIVRHNYTKNQDIISALDTLSIINCPVKGIIYNDAPIEPYGSNFVYNSNEFSCYANKSR